MHKRVEPSQAYAQVFGEYARIAAPLEAHRAFGTVRETRSRTSRVSGADCDLFPIRIAAVPDREECGIVARRDNTEIRRMIDSRLMRGSGPAGAQRGAGDTAGEDRAHHAPPRNVGGRGEMISGRIRSRISRR